MQAYSQNIINMRHGSFFSGLLLILLVGTVVCPSIRNKMLFEAPVMKVHFHHPAEKVKAYEYRGEDGGIQYGGVKKRANWAAGEEQGRWATNKGKFGGVDPLGWKTKGKFGQENGAYNYHHKGKDGSEQIVQAYSSSSYVSSSSHN